MADELEVGTYATAEEFLDDYDAEAAGVGFDERIRRAALLEADVLKAAKEERDAELALVSEMERLQCYGAETARRLNDATAARRRAVDSLRRARPGRVVEAKEGVK